jgi:transcriptional regulator with XRE-family HTH domain
MPDMATRERARRGDWLDEFQSELPAYRRRLGRKVAAARALRDWTQGQLATATGINRQAISLLEKGRRGLLVEEVYLIAYATGVPLQWFFGPLDEVPERSTTPEYFSGKPFVSPRPALILFHWSPRRSTSSRRVCAAEID